MRSKKDKNSELYFRGTKWIDLRLNKVGKYCKVTSKVDVETVRILKRNFGRNNTPTAYANEVAVVQPFNLIKSLLNELMCQAVLNQIFRNHLEDIMYSTVKMDDPYDRVTVMQWIRKLHSLDDSTLEMAQLRNQYADYLRMSLDSSTTQLCVPFKGPPPEDDLRPLCEVLANNVAKKYPQIPMTGPIEPIMSQTSEDGKVFTAVRQHPGGGLFCYLAVTPEGFEKL